MFFGGDYSNGKRVNCGGRSSRERDERKILEQTPLGRKKLRDEETAKRIRQKMKEEESVQRLKNSAALRIQVYFKKKEVEGSRMQERFKIFEGIITEMIRMINTDYEMINTDYERHFRMIYQWEIVSNFNFFPLMISRFFQENKFDDFLTLVGTYYDTTTSGDVWRLFVLTGKEHISENPCLILQMKKLARACIRALDNQLVQSNFCFLNLLKDENLLEPNASATLLLGFLTLLTEYKLPWSCKILKYISLSKGFIKLRNLILSVKDNSEKCVSGEKGSPLEHFLRAVILHTGQRHCLCSVIDIDPKYSFASQILTIPSLWHVFPNLKKVFARQGMISFLTSLPPGGISKKTYADRLGNIFAIGGVPSRGPDIPYDPIDLAAVATFLVETQPSPTRSENSMIAKDDMTADDEVKEVALDQKLEQQSCNSTDTRLLVPLTDKLFEEISKISNANCSYDMELVAVDAVCGFLYVIFNAFPLERFMSKLAYASKLIPLLWDFIEGRHELKQVCSLPYGVTGWLLPLAVFCPIYTYMLRMVDNDEEFFKQKKPLSLNDIRSLVIMLKQALCQLLSEDNTSSANSVRSIPVGTSNKRLSVEAIQQWVIIKVSELLSELQDWNNRKQFTSPSDFHVDGVNDFFISQAVIENTLANNILKKAPFLIPFTSRFHIYTSLVHAAQLSTQKHFKIRRNHCFDDTCTKIGELSAVDLRGKIRVTFEDEHGIQEAGIDGGGLFKELVDNIIRDPFGVQYGLFKETEDHLLYPNPKSEVMQEDHLKLFHFLGTFLGKAMFQRIHVDLPFAKFFLRKLIGKDFNLKDLKSLDPELYGRLISLKSIDCDISDLGIYFAITIINENGKEEEEEFFPGGMGLRVTNENFHDYIYHVIRRRLDYDYQIEEQCSSFFDGLYQLIPKDLIAMFNEEELQLLISGSLDNLDVDDLQLHTNYVGYNSEHDVIKTFWEVFKGFKIENKRKFLKFVTGCTRGPLLGFVFLEPLFCIQRAGGTGNANEDVQDRLPAAATCFNRLKLPPYGSKDQLESKLIYAINSDAGFDLS